MAGSQAMKFTAALALALALLLDSAHKATAATCAEAGAQIQPCIPSLSGQIPTPSSTCCLGLATIQKMEGQIGVKPLCNCTKLALMQVPGLVIDFQTSFDLQNNCTVKLSFSLSTTDPCTT